MTNQLNELSALIYKHAEIIAAKNIEKQAQVGVRYDGKILVFIKPADLKSKKDDFVKVISDSGTLILEFDVVDAIEREVKYWAEENACLDIRAEKLRNIAARINDLADSISSAV